MQILKDSIQFWNSGGIINWIILVSSFFLFSEILKNDGKEFSNKLVSVFAPLGLLGTVAGMIQTFRLISSGNIDKISEGISIALLTTLSGLTISIVGIVMLSLKKK